MVLLLAATLGLGGCEKRREKREKPPKLDIVSVDKLSGSIFGNCNLTVTFANNTIFKVGITSGEVTLKYNGRKIGQIAMQEDFSLPPRKHTQVTIPLRVTFSSSLNALGAINSVRQGKLSTVSIDYSIIAKVLSSKLTFEEKDLTLEEINKEWNLGLKK